ncbi:hypothetical protein [Pelosinus sp. sgz500959]|uniref:hypothetical protein n=1 Tax=Pelosinus sp. sgz500959 TaxID=3242472 RepID=UPI00366BF5B1
MICSLFIVLWEENQDEISSQVCRSFEDAEIFKQDLIDSYKISSDDIKIHEIKSSVKLSLLVD